MTPNPSDTRTLVWDAPVRVFHWLLVLCFAGAWLTAESERWRLLHVTLGYTAGGLLAFRLLWGLIGTRHARFAGFVRGPRAVLAYLQSLWRGRPQVHAGHNPAGGWAIVALLAGVAAITASGWAVYQDLGGEWLEELHEAAATLTLGLVALHVAGVVVGSLVHGDNLVATMFSGRKCVPPQEGIRRAWRPLAALMITAVLGFWALQWRDAPAPLAGGPATHARAGHDRDDD